MLKISRGIALSTALLIAIITFAVGFTMIVMVVPFIALMTTEFGAIFFLCGLIFFCLTIKILKVYWKGEYPDQKLIFYHTGIMFVGTVLFDWRCIFYLPFITIYLLPVLIQTKSIVK